LTAGALEPILSRARERLSALPPAADLRRAAAGADPPRSLRTGLVAGRVLVIAEMKRRSPSAGVLRPDLDPPATAQMYEAAGAAAISVLTEPDFFGGSLDDLRAARQATQRPILRKDFVIDPLQVFESRAAGADLVLLIVRALPEAGLRDCLRAAAALGMEALVEVHDRGELELALDLGAELIGINNRDLDLLTTDLAVTERLAPLVPADRYAISESGISGAGDVRRLRACGVRAVLVGESLLRAPDPAAALRQLTAAGIAP
jgi:indole-3-glycerol phosphate synthase